MFAVLDPIGRSLEVILGDVVLFGDEQSLPANARIVDGNVVDEAFAEPCHHVALTA